MSSSSDFTSAPDTPVTAGSATTDAPHDAGEHSGVDEPDGVAVDGSLEDLHRETSAMLRTLADRYDAEATDKRAQSARHRAEADAAEALASQLAEESARIRADADRLGTRPPWLGDEKGRGTPGGGSSDVPPAGPADDAPTVQASYESSEQSGHSDQFGHSGQSDQLGEPAVSHTAAEHSEQSAQSYADAPPGPGPARGFASESGSAELSGTDALPAESGTEAVAGSGTEAAPAGSGPTNPEIGAESDDWAPRPFESWRNQTSRVVPRLLGL